jgi:hypothetical protein
MAARKNSKKKSVTKALETARTRKPRPYPASSFKDALPLGEGIMKYAAGEKVRRLTLAAADEQVAEQRPDQDDDHQLGKV